MPSAKESTSEEVKGPTGVVLLQSMAPVVRTKNRQPGLISLMILDIKASQGHPALLNNTHHLSKGLIGL